MSFLSPPSSSSTSSSTTTKTKHINRLFPHSNNSSSRASTPSNHPLPGPSSRSTSPSPAPALSSTLSLPPHPKPHHNHHKEHHGMRAHLAEFLPLPRQAVFDVKLTIHQLWNVPLVSGDFSVKWRFQHVHREKGGTKRPGTPNANTSAFLQLPSTPTTTSVTSGTASSSSGGHTPDNTGFLSDGVHTAFMSRSASGSGSVSGKGKGRDVPVPMLNVHIDHDSERDSVMTTSGASMLSIPSTSEGSCSSASLSPRTNSVDLPGDAAATPPSRKNSFGAGASNNNGSNGKLNGHNGGGNGEGAEFSHEARGRTPYVALREHHVKFGQTVSVTVHIAVQRDTHELHPCELKLIVEQLSNPTDPTPQNPRLGAVYLNLAEYVDKGPVMRRHLLRESKTNATLQLTIELTHVGGESNYKAPPLQKGEVMAGVSALLEKTAVGGAPRPRPAYDRTVSRPAVKTHRRGTDRRDVFGIGGAGVVGDDLGRPSIPLGGGIGLGIGGIGELGGLGAGPGVGTGVVGSLKTTENIIEAIFNPVPSSSPAPSPFTYFIPPRPPATPVRSLSMNTTNTTCSSLGSGSISISGSTGASGSGSGSGDVDVNDDADAELTVEHDFDPSPRLNAARILAPSITSRTSRISRRSDRSVATTDSSVSHQSSQSLEELGNGKGRDGANAAEKSGSGSGSGSGVGGRWWKRFGGSAKNEGESVGGASASASASASETSRPASPLPRSYPHPHPRPHPLQQSQTQAYSQDRLDMRLVSPGIRAQIQQGTHTHTHNTH